VVIIFPAIYRQAWLKARAIRRRHKPLSDEFLWHDVYNFYAENLPRLTPEAELDIVRAWQVTGDELARARLLEAFYYIVRPIAGQIATKRFPPPLKMTRVAFDGQRVRIHELASVGIFGLFVAANRFDLGSGHRFSTYANTWVRKYIQLYCEETVSTVPRTGHMGPDPSCPGLDLPRRSVMDIVEAALDGRRLYRGKAAGGMAVFDAGLLIDGTETEGGKFPDFEYLSTEGPTREYLQRRVGVGGARFVWPKVVSRDVMTPWIDESKARPTDLIELPPTPVERKPVFFGGELFSLYGPSAIQIPQPSEVCYLAKQRPDRQFNSYDKGEVALDELEKEGWRKVGDSYVRSKDRKDTKHEIEILRRADAVQTSPGVSSRRGRCITQAHDVPVSILSAGAD
jgi:Sigma-70 region 2